MENLAGTETQAAAAGEPVLPGDAVALLTVLSEPPEREIEMPCIIEAQSGETMQLRIARAIPLDTALSIQAGESLWLGQTQGCKEQEHGWVIDVHLSHYLRRLPELTRMAERFRGAPSEGRRASDGAAVNSNE